VQASRAILHARATGEKIRGMGRKIALDFWCRSACCTKECGKLGFLVQSQQNRMKAHKHQWLWAEPYSPEHLSEATDRRHALAPEAQKPSQ